MRIIGVINSSRICLDLTTTLPVQLTQNTNFIASAQNVSDRLKVRSYASHLRLITVWI